MGSVPESSKDAGETVLESSHSGAEANKASTSASKNLLEELDLLGLAVDTLAEDFQVGNHMNRLLFSFLLESLLRIFPPDGSVYNFVLSSFYRVRGQRSRWE